MNIEQLVLPFSLTLLAGLSTVVGSLIFLSHILRGRRNMGFFLGLSAGVMIYLSFVELLSASIISIGFLYANISFFVGIVVMALIDNFLPHHYLEERICRKHAVVDRQMLSSGLVVTVGLVIHNFPEGMAVFLSAFTDIRLGLLMALAIAAHNIPEGIAVAAPIYHATESWTKAIKYAFISGMAEPMGAIIAFLLLRPYMSAVTISYVLALVAGVMVYVSFDELLPTCFKDGHCHKAIVGIVLGMMLVSFSLLFL